MLYPTHKRYGILWGLLMFPIGVLLGVIPILSVSMRPTDIFMLVVCCYLGMRGALFGAEFPDIDSPGSVPAHKHPVIRKIFEFFHVKHRGKFSHDYFSLLLLFGGSLFVLSFAGRRWIDSIVSGSTLWGTISYMSLVVFVWMVALDLVDFLKWLANLMQNRRMWAVLHKKRFVIGFWNVVWLSGVLWVAGVFKLGALFTGNIDLSSGIQSAMILLAAFKVYIIFAWAGAYSHLFADMTTKSGVSIFFIPVAPAKVALKLKKVPLVGRLLVPTDFKTGTGWEDLNRYVATVLCVPAFILAVLALSGFDVSKVMHVVLGAIGGV